MAAGKWPLRMLVMVGLGGACLFLCLRLRQAGHLRITDWLTAGGIFVLSVLLVRAARPRGSDWRDSETSEDETGHRRGLLWIILLPLLLWALYGGSDRLGLGGKKSQDRVKTLQTPRIMRTLAGQADETGWVPALSDAGGFSVRVPDLFNEAIATLKLNGRPTPVVIVGARAGELKFVVLAAKWTGGGKDLKARVKSAARSLSRFKKPVASREESFGNGFPAIEVEGDAPEAKGFAKIIATDTAVYGLEVEGPELTDEMREAARTFFDSFAIVAPEPNEAMIRDAIKSGDPNR
jgi:hypothetical protein